MDSTADGFMWASQLRATTERLSALFDSTVEDADVSSAQARLLLEEMGTAVEELRVAEEELVVQGEQLAASQLAIDVERERYVGLFEFAPDAYLETDALGRIIEANGAAERLLGVPVRSLVGKLVHSFVSPGEVRALRQALASICDSPEPITPEVGLAPRGLPSVTVEVRVGSHAEPMAGSSGEVRVRWLLRDITERLKLDHEVRQFSADVELLAALGDVNRLVAGSPDPVDPMLHGLVELAVRVSGGAEAGISILDQRGGMAARAVSGPVALELGELQLSSGGPASAVLEERRPRHDDATDLGEWPELADAMARHGVEWIVSQPIVPVDGGEVGVFNLYGRGSTADVERPIQLLAEHAAGIISNGLLYSSATELAGQLAKALESAA